MGAVDQHRGPKRCPTAATASMGKRRAVGEVTWSTTTRPVRSEQCSAKMAVISSLVLWMGTSATTREAPVRAHNRSRAVATAP